MEEQKLKQPQSSSLIDSLISSSFDKDAVTKQAICNSLSYFGRKQPDLVLDALQSFLRSHTKIDQMHRLLLLNCMKDIVDNCSDINVDVAKKVVALASEDLTNSKKLNKECQNAASHLLASLGKYYLIEVVEELLKNFVPGFVAHNYVIQTLGQLATSNIPGMKNHINYILATTVSQLSLVKSDGSRIVFADSLGNFSDYICELYSNPELSQDMPKGAFAQQFNSAFDILFIGWLLSKSSKVQCAVIQSLGKMSLLLAQNELEHRAPKLIASVIVMYRRHPNDRLTLTSSLCNIITALVSKESQVLVSTLELLTTNLHIQVCSIPDDPEPMLMKNYNEVLRCFGILATSYSSILTGMILQRTEARDEKTRAGNVVILKHLINSHPVQMKEHQDLIITGFQKCLNDPSNRVKHHLAKLVITMGTHGFLHREGGHKYVKFILRQCTLPNYDHPSKVAPTVTNEQLRDMCADILHLLTTSVTNADRVLWPYLFEFVADQGFTNALGVIVRSLSILAQNKKEAASEEPVMTSPDEPVITSSDEPVITSSDEPVITSSDKPVMTSPDEPVITSPDEPVMTSPEEPVITSPEEPVITSPEEPTITSPEEPVIASPEEPTIALSDEPVITSPDEPVVTPSEEPVMTSSNEPMINFETAVNIPRPTGLLSRMLVMLARPEQTRMYPESFLNLLLCIAPCFHDKLPDLFQENIPTMLAFLTENGNENDQWPRDEWENIMLQFLSAILDEIADEDWSCSLGHAMTSQWPLYEFLPEYKNFAFKCLGVILQKIKNREFVSSYISLLLMSVNHAIPTERQGAAMCLGRCASSHLDAVLEKLNEFVNTNITKKESSYLNIFKSERSHVEVEQYKGTSSLSCGYIAWYAPVHLILSRLEMNIIKTLTNLSKNIKTSQVRMEWVEAVRLIAASLDPDRLISSPTQPRYVFAAREDILNKLLSYLKDDIAEKATELKASILLACAALVKLDPPMSDTEMSSTFNRSLSRIIPIYKSTLHGENNNLVLLCTNNLNQLLEESLKKRPNSTRLLSIFKHLEPYLVSESDHERAAAIQLTRVVLEKFYDVVVVAETANVLHNTGLLIARILPSCCDSLPTVRLEALICIRQLLRVLDKHHDRNYDSDKMALLEHIGGNLIADDMRIVYASVTELSKMLCSKLPSDLLQFGIGSLTVCLFESLHWSAQSTAYGACLVLSYIFESRGAMFSHNVNDVVSVIVGKLSQMNELNRPAFVVNAVLDILCLFARHHLGATIKVLLAYPLPYSTVMQMCWARLGQDQSTAAMIDALLDMSDRSLPYEEKLKRKGKPKEGSDKTATATSLSISCALHELLTSSLSQHTEESTSIQQKYRYRILAMALVRVGSMYDVKAPPKLKMDPYKQAVELLGTVVTSLYSETMNSDLEQVDFWTALQAKDGLNNLSFAVGCFVRELAKQQASDITHVVPLLNNYLPSIYDLQRVTVVAFFAQLVRENSTHTEVLLGIIMNNLRSRLVDSHNYVRQLCIIGLGNIIHASQDQIERYSTSVLSAMMAGMDDSEDYDHSIALAAMSGLANFLNKAKQVNIHSMFVNICLRARPCFEKEDPRVRSAAVDLFGALAQFANGDLQAAFTEQAHSNFISLLMHLNDDVECVRKSCKNTLRQVGRHIGSESMKETFHNVLLDASVLHYGEFMNNLSKIMISDFPDKINFYIMECVSFYKSEWPVVRCNAALVSGFLMSNLNEENRSTINSEHVCSALIQLLKDSSPAVRSKAAEAISLLHEY